MNNLIYRLNLVRQCLWFEMIDANNKHYNAHIINHYKMLEHKYNRELTVK